MARAEAVAIEEAETRTSIFLGYGDNQFNSTKYVFIILKERYARSKYSIAF